MQLEQPQMQYEEEDYQGGYSSPQVDTLTELLITPNDDKFIEMIVRLKGDPDKYAHMLTELKQYSGKNKDAMHLKNLQARILNLMANLKEQDRYTASERQKNIIWIFQKLCCNDHILSFNEQSEETFLNIFTDFTNFEDFSAIIKITKNILLKSKPPSPQTKFAERLYYLYNQKYQKLQIQQISMRFSSTMKNLDEQSKLIIKAEIINFSSLFTTGTISPKFRVEQSQMSKILSVLTLKPYKKLLQSVIQKRLKSIKQLRTSILKTKMQIIEDKVEMIFGAKCELCKQLKTKEIFELTAKKSDGSELIPEIQAQSLILHGDYLYTKWSVDILISSKEKVSYDSSEEQINQGFLKILSYLKKLFEHRHKHIQVLENHNKIVEENKFNEIPRQTVDYICQVLQVFVKYLSFNSLQINHRSQNLAQLIPGALFDEILLFFQDQLAKQLKQNKEQQLLQKESKQKESKQKKPLNLIQQTIDYLITFSAHLFYRRDFQALTPITSKTSQTIIRIMLMVDSFPIRWNILRNYKLVIDRWGQTVDEACQQYKKLANKFLSAYFSQKVTVYSKSSSTVFNPIFVTRPYCKIFGNQFFKFVQGFQKALDQLEAKCHIVGVSREMNSTMSKIILFMSARIRFQDVNKIAEHLQRIYRKYAHVIPQIYLFRAWIMQVNFAKIPQSQIEIKLVQSSSILKQLSQVLTPNICGRKLLTPIYSLNEQQNAYVLKLLNAYKSSAYRALNSLQIKTKNEQYTQVIMRQLWEITHKNIQLLYAIKLKTKQVQNENQQEYKQLIEQNNLFRQNSANGSIFSIVQTVQTDFVAVVRYYLCNAEKILNSKDYSVLVRIVGQWMCNQVLEAGKNKDKFFYSLTVFHKIFGFKLPTGFSSHLTKKQILGAMRAINGGDQLDLTKIELISFNQVSSLYQEIKPVYAKLIKFIIQEPEKQKSIFQQPSYQKQLLQLLILPNTNIVGPCYFNNKMQDKSTQDMVLGVFWEQSQGIFKNFSVQELIKLNQKYPLSSMLEITKNKLSKIIQVKSIRNPNGNQANNIFGRNARQVPQRGAQQAMQQLRQVNIPEEYIQLALQNIQMPDAQLALQWIQNNQDRIDSLLVQKVIRESKQQQQMKSQQQSSDVKIQVNKIATLKYQQFIDILEKTLKNLVKSLVKEMFSQQGNLIIQLLFIILDSFKEDYKKKQYQYFADRMFKEIDNLNAQKAFDNSKYRLIQKILILTMKKQPGMFTEYYKKVCLKVLTFVPHFGKSLGDKKQDMTGQKRLDFIQLLEIINVTLPQCKLADGSSNKNNNEQFIKYLQCLLTIIQLSQLGNSNVWQILYKVSLYEISSLTSKIIRIFSSLTQNKAILSEQQQKIALHNKQLKLSDKKARNIISLSTMTLPTQTYILPLAKLLLEQDLQLLEANIQLEIKGYLLGNYGKEINLFEDRKNDTNSKYSQLRLEKINQQEINKLESKDKSKQVPEAKAVLEVDLKKFTMGFDKFVGSKVFEKVFKRLFTKKKNKKNSLFYDLEKHPLQVNQSINQLKSSFLSSNYSSSVEQMLSTFINRAVALCSNDKNLQQQALSDLYKLLDYFKVLIPTAIRIEWMCEDQQNNEKKTNLLEWLMTKSIASNKKKFQFMLFLAMKNHLVVGKNQSISDYVSHQYLEVIRAEIQKFSMWNNFNNKKIREATKREQDNKLSQNNINQEKISEEKISEEKISEEKIRTGVNYCEKLQPENRLRKVLFSFLYLLQLDTLNSQCFLSISPKQNNSSNTMSEQLLSQPLPIFQLLQQIFIQINIQSSPLLYSVVSQCLFILNKRLLIERLKQKYKISQKQPSTGNQKSPLNCSIAYKKEFLSMSLIYKVDPSASLNDRQSGNKKKRNPFNGSNGRILVDELDDQEQAFNQMEDMDDEMGDEYDSITNLLRMRLVRRHESRQQRSNQLSNEQAELVPLQMLPTQLPLLLQSPIIEPQPSLIQPQPSQIEIQSNIEPDTLARQLQRQTDLQQNKKQQEQINKYDDPNKRIDYAQNLILDAQRLRNFVQILEKILPKRRLLDNRTKQQLLSTGTDERQKQKQIMEPELHSSATLYISKINDLASTLTSIIQYTSTLANPSILPPDSRFSSNTQTSKPQFTIRLALNQPLKKLIRFQKRFKSLITTLIPETVTSSSYQNEHTPTSYRTSMLRQQLQDQMRQAPSARSLLYRLERQSNGENRDEMIHHIERLINQRRNQDLVQQNTRPRVLNLNQAIQQLPEQLEAPKIVQEKPNVQQNIKVDQNPKVEQKKQQKKEEQIVSSQNKQQKIVQQKNSELPQPQQPLQKMQQQKPQQQIPQISQKQNHQSQPPASNQMMAQLSELINVQEPIIPEQQFQLPAQFDEELNLPIQNAQVIQPPSQVPQQINQPQHIEPYREILAMFGLAQSFLSDNGIDPESFDYLPEEFQIDQITHYMNQAQNRANINQLSQANIQQSASSNNSSAVVPPNQQGQQPAVQPANNTVNDVLQQNIALFASMDPQTRAQMLADYPPQFLLQLPVQMRTQVEQFRQRQLNRIVQEQQQEEQMVNYNDQREEDLRNIPGARKLSTGGKNKANYKYPKPQEINFNPIQQPVARHLAQCLFLRVSKIKIFQGFRILLENHTTKNKALATIVGILRMEEGQIKLTQAQYLPASGNGQKQAKGKWKVQKMTLNDPQQLNDIKQSLLFLVLQTLLNPLYKDDLFLLEKKYYTNYLDIKIAALEQLSADEQGFWPLHQLLPYSLELCPKLTIQILKRIKQAKSLPYKLISAIVQAIKSDKLSSQVYKHLQFLSKDPHIKQLFLQQFPEERPLKLDIFAKIIKFQFARVPYIRKMHEQALNFYNAQYNEFLNQIFSIYTIQDIKEIQSLLIKHKHIHFQVIKYLYSQNRVLDKEPIGLVLKMPYLLDFETKKYLFRKHPKIRRASRYRLPIEVSRTNILQQSYNQIMEKTPKQLEGRLQITFMDEQGYDAGGLTREWLMCLSREIFRPDYALFEPSSSGNTYQPNPKSFINPDHLKYFKFIGRFVGKALAQNQLVDAYFTRAVYKMILGQQIQLSDLQQQDYAFYKSMLWLKQNAIEQGDYTFSYLYDNFGQRIIKDLIPGGRSIEVSQENKLQYIQKYCLAKMRDDFKNQMEKFLEGFHQIVPHECISFFQAKELELLISGLPEISFEDLKVNVDYSGFSPTDQAIKWFWQILEQFTQEDLARLIQFITGTSKIPVDGFANIKGMNGPQRISIHKDPNSHQLPKAHTCFNQLDLPNYATKEIMRQRLVTAITWGSEGFGFM